jgi:NitT/TauT family transport system substrate-binding protein
MRNAKAPLALALAAALAASIAPAAVAQDAAGAECDLTGTTPVTLQLQWVTQAQFAGFFAAHDKCFYAERGLDVTLQEADPQGTAPHVVGSQDGGPEFTVSWVPKVLELRGKGESTLVHIGQHLSRSGTLAISFADKGITSVADWAGKTVGVWPAGNEYEMTAAIEQAGITDQVNRVDNFFNMVPFVQGEQDVAAAMIYNELAQVLEVPNPATGELYQLDDLSIIDFKDVGTAMLQDAIWAREEWLAEEGNEELATRFLAASYEGWMHCRENPDECVDIVLNRGSTLGASHQAWQMNEINALVWPTAEGGIGTVNQSDWDQTVQIGIDAKILTGPPDEGARRDDLTAAALGLIEGDTIGADFQKAQIVLQEGGV